LPALDCTSALAGFGASGVELGEPFAMPENHVNFVYKLDGDVQEVDVFRLAPTLLALGELIQESNQEVNPTGRQIGVNVKPFREGSFIVDLTIFPQTNLQQVLDLLGSQSAGQVKLLLEWIGLITGSGGIVGVVQLIKWLKGRPKAVDEIKPGEFRYTAGDDRSITVDVHVHQLFSSSRITNNIYKVYGAPMEDQSSVTDIRTYVEGESGTEVVFERSEVPIVREFMDPSATLTSSGEIVKEHVQEGVFLNPKRGSFENDPRDWSFYSGRGRNDVITATIKDKAFLQDYEDGKYRLLSSELLTVTLLERQTVEGTIVKKPVYEILRVTNYIKGPEQKMLPGV
jgi:hypothetical protein